MNRNAKLIKLLLRIFILLAIVADIVYVCTGPAWRDDGKVLQEKEARDPTDTTDTTGNTVAADSTWLDDNVVDNTDTGDAADYSTGEVTTIAVDGGEFDEVDSTVNQSTDSTDCSISITRDTSGTQRREVFPVGFYNPKVNFPEVDYPCDSLIMLYPHEESPSGSKSY